MLNRKVVILGGGTAGWMTAAALARYLLVPHGPMYSIELVESDGIGTVGVGEATLPHLRQFNEMLGIDENTFIRATGATYKLAIQFPGWGSACSSYIHPFGLAGHDINGIDFHHYWLRLYNSGRVSPYDEYSIAVLMAQKFKFQYPSDDIDSVLAEYGYAFHIDASLYAKYLREYAEKLGVKRTEGKVAQVHQDEECGNIQALVLESGETIPGDLFIDCSGFRGVLIEDTLKTGYESWQHWLPCDRAFAVPSQRVNSPPPYTRASAKKVGWQWRIPLQHRTGNGYVYSSAYINDEDAERLLIEGLEEDATAEPRQLRFVAGKRHISWNKNCVAIGLSAGFLEPLESTSIYLIQIAIQKLIECFPSAGITDVERGAFNRHLNTEYERVRDFIILHYHVNRRDDSDFWRYCRTMSIPDSLAEKMELFRENGRVVSYRKGLFMPASWLMVYLGQGLIPSGYDKRVDWFPIEEVERYLANYKALIDEESSKMPDHHLAISKANEIEHGVYPRAAFNLYGVKG